MGSIRRFQNVDLPHLAQVWIEHWGAAGENPAVSAAMIEQAVLSRTFFDTTVLLVAGADSGTDSGSGPLARQPVDAWCHLVPDPNDQGTMIMAGICFSSRGLDVCDDLLICAQHSAMEAGFERMVVGTMRDQSCGYLGLPPLGHGFGVSTADTRTASLLTRHGYTPAQKIARMAVSTNPYRMPVKRSLMQLRRSTRTQSEQWFPSDRRHASAMAHIDIEHHELINHLNGERLAQVDLWLSDPEAQVFGGSKAILDLSALGDSKNLSEPEQFLIGSIVSTAAIRHIFEIETAVDSDNHPQIEKLSELHFEMTQQGCRWVKELTS